EGDRRGSQGVERRQLSRAVQDLRKRVLRVVSAFALLQGLLLFLPARSLHFWEAWLYWTTYSVVSLLMTLDFPRHDPAVIQRRLLGPGAERDGIQILLGLMAALSWFALMMIPGFEHRRHPSSVPAAVVLVGDAVMLLALLMIFRVMQAN